MKFSATSERGVFLSTVLLICSVLSLGNRGCAEGIYAPPSIRGDAGVGPDADNDAGDLTDAGQSTDAGEPSSCLTGAPCPEVSDLIQIGAHAGEASTLFLAKNVEGAAIPQAIPVTNRASAAGIRILDFGVIEAIDLIDPRTYQAPYNRAFNGVSLSTIPAGEFFKPCAVGALLLPFQTCYIYATVSHDADPRSLVALISAEILGLEGPRINYAFTALTPAESTADPLAFLPVGRTLHHSGSDSLDVMYAQVTLDDDSNADLLFWDTDRWAHSVRSFNYRLSEGLDRLVHLNAQGAQAVVWKTDSVELLDYAQWTRNDLLSFRSYSLFTEERWNTYYTSRIRPLLAPGSDGALSTRDITAIVRTDGSDVAASATIHFTSADRVIEMFANFIRSERRWVPAGSPHIISP